MTIKNRAGLWFVIPGIIWVLCFTLFPLLYSLALSFTDKRMGRRNRPGEWIGVQNYSDIFADNRVSEVLEMTLFVIIGGVLVTIVLGTFIAWLFNHDIPGLRAFRAILTLPIFAAPIALGQLGMILFNEQSGPVNHLITGLGGEPVYWLTEPWAARFAVLIVDAWQWTPFVFIIVLAAMQSIPDELYEAARLDTANAWTLFRRITLPLIAPALGTITMLRMVETFKILDIPYTLTGGGPGVSTQTYSYYIYLTGLRNFDMGYASALAYLLVIVAIIITSIFFWRVRARYEVQ
ncbi:MAG TPA: sugar ABC transporter permease [Aggregatilinea sp.]|jgi:multiple sugar transport system permease protein|uniref:carbohydrate ABC transporter permease n=1 Tax=Aggregatilinea sp. TaxID=2806333 RepID=UPI002C3A5C14|nr:sugar ABC transporter permease [Aggregatilinea sp.]HML21493.1 sugar ABC transporter permease [Aggregatilinea sp.]